MTLQDRFERRYLESLHAYRFFYDDVCEYGCADSATQVFYFIPGLNGVPGQIRFALPGIHRVLGNRFYIRCLHLPEFASTVPVWAKYTAPNLDRRQSIMVEDLEEMAFRHARILVVASSTAFYEFAAAFEMLSLRARRSITLLWVAAAPDRVAPSPWEALFYPFSGIERGGYRWSALPNHNLLASLNPETRTTFRWHGRTGTQPLHKSNLESRFRLWGLSWGYFSTACTNWVFQRSIAHIRRPLDVRAFVLAAEQDGYWQGMGKDGMEAVVRNYLARPEFLWRKASHLWVNVPENISALVSAALGGCGDPVPKPAHDQWRCLQEAGMEVKKPN